MKKKLCSALCRLGIFFITFFVFLPAIPVVANSRELAFLQQHVSPVYDLSRNYGKGCQLKNHEQQNFSNMKKQLRILYTVHYPYTFYCECRFTWNRETNKLFFDTTQCGYRKKSWKAEDFVNWEHVMPASRFGGHLSCWNDAICFDEKKGKKFRGRKCCNEVDSCFNIMEGDIHNIVPEIYELNSDRKNFSFGIIEGEKREYGLCDFEVDFRLDRVEPRDAIRGDIARIYFYMSWFYGIPLTEQEKKQFHEWNRLDPPSEVEKRIHALKAKIQGNENPFISYYRQP